jgi:two-component system NtrC family sensor kinase
MAFDFKETTHFLKDIIAKKTPYSLSFKLIFAIGPVVLISGTIFWYLIITKGENEFLNSSIRNTMPYVELIEQSIFENMHAQRIGTIQRTIETIGTSENIQEIKIYDIHGDISFASDRDMVGTKVERDSPSCRICHDDPQRPHETLKLQNKEETAWTIVKDRDRNRTLKLARAILNRKTCSASACHYHPSDKKILSILETDYSLARIDATLRSQKVATISFGIVFTLFFCVGLCIILWKIVIKPLYVLADGMDRVTQGDLDGRIEMDTKDELGMIANAFNAMTRELKSDRQKLENWAKELEEEVERKTREIRKGQEHLFHTEKLASLGRMAAGVAHEINSPLTGIVTFAHLMLKRVPPENKMDQEDLEVIIEQAERCSRIIKGLLGFSRAIPAQRATIDINATIRHCLEIIENQAKFHNIKLTKDLSPEIPHIQGDASQLEQVYMNLLINAADAMNNRGTIAIATRIIAEDERDWIEIEFTDSGSGMSEEQLSRIFEPFFTTKPVGKGTGLGLAVSHGIVRKHGGHMRVKSTPKKGTSFYLKLPASEQGGAEEVSMEK